MKSFTAVVALALASVAAVTAAPAEKRVDPRLYYKIVAPYYVANPNAFCSDQWNTACINLSTAAGAPQAPTPSCTYNANLEGGVIMADCIFQSSTGSSVDATSGVGSYFEAGDVLAAA